MKGTRLGVVTSGAYNTGLTVRLDPDVSTENLRIGDFVVVEGEQNLYFSLVEDMELATSDPRLLVDPPRDASSLVRRALAGTNAYGTVVVRPLLMMEKVDYESLTLQQEETRPQPVRTIPMHFAILREANEVDFATVFGNESQRNYFAMGTPLTMDIPICLRLDRFAERSSGIFGQSGTGKSFLARLLLCGIIQSGVAVNLIFDMHDEYAFDKQTEDKRWVKGLRQLFGSRVRVYSLDERDQAQRGRNVDVVLKIGLNQIEAQDVVLLAEELNLRQTTEATIGLLSDQYKESWLQRLLSMEPVELEEFCATSGAHPGSVAALQRNLKRIGRQPYIVPEAPFSVIDDMVNTLDTGQHIILTFGRHNSVLDYILVANLITRRVRKLYEEKMRRFEETRDEADRPRQLMITIEEAHKFLNPAVSRQTIFGTIAREMRKYNVTLLVIDQRPSGIDTEVMSQLGTRVSGKLTEQRDIDAVLTGVASRETVRSALASLDTRQEVVMIGHAVPMPVVVRTRNYDENFYATLTARRDVKEDVMDLYGPQK
ncbi:MAG: ATP-binding protein [Chloroflexi bacterium]|nr:ATP-binding protein [Chloroflexota bacterium]